VILAKTIKGWTLGPDVEGRNATHQIKELTNKQLLACADAPPAGGDPRGVAPGRRRCPRTSGPGRALPSTIT
jgi:hypothetical protein